MSADRAEPDFSVAVSRLLERRCADPDLTLAEVASAVGVSERQVQRRLRSSLGMTFRELLLETRMKRARRLLESEKGHSVEAVARRVGYRGPSGLRQAFARYWGMVPSSVRPTWDLDADYDRRYRAAEQEARDRTGLVHDD